MSQTPETPVSSILPAYIAVLDDDARTQFFADHPEVKVLHYSGAAWHKSDMLRRAGDMPGAVAILSADDNARWMADYARRCKEGAPSTTGRVMSGLYAAGWPFLFGTIGAGLASAIGSPGLVALMTSVATVGACIGGFIGAVTAPRGC